MNVPEKADSLNIQQDINGRQNQTIGGMNDDSKAFNNFRDVVLEQNNTYQPVALSTSPFQLPLSTHDFTGRQAELEQIYAALEGAGQSGTVVFSAVAGMAGVGKSALAIYAAHQSDGGAFPRCAAVCELAGRRRKA